MKWPFDRDQARSVRLGALFVLILLAGPFSATAPARVQPSPDEGRDAKRKSQPSPTPFIQREEVRFVTLDLVIEQRGGPGGKGWHPARDLTKERVHVFVGSQEMVLDLFENWCGAVPPGSSPEAVVTASSEASNPSSAQHEESATVQSGAGSAEVQNSSAQEPHKYILYFDLQQLTTAGRDRAFRAAMQWAQRISPSSDEVMILTGGLSLRIVRPMLPASRHLMEDLEAARADARAVDMWAQGEEARIREIIDTKDPALARFYATIDYDVARRSLDNMSRLMTTFGSIPGTKDLVYFSETVRLFPGSEYPFGPSPKAALSQDVAQRVYDLAAQANERNVRIYAVQASGLGLQGEADIEEPLLVLSEETGGRPVYNTNNLGAVFDRTAEDFSCFYRVGFRLSSGHSGNLKTILVRIGESGRGYRVRHRRSVDDPTPQEQEQDRLTAAFLAPESAQAFPVELRLARLFDYPRGSRVRIDVEVPVDALLALPAGDPDRLQVNVQFGGQAVPLRSGFAPAGSSERNAWADVDPARGTFTFNRQAEIHLSTARAASRRPARIVYSIEMDVPPGDYRVIVAVQDEGSGSVAARLADLHTEESLNPLGEIGIGIEDPAILIIQAPDPTEKERSAKSKGKPEILPAEHSLPPKLSLSRSEPVDRNGKPSFFYALCGPQAAPAKGDHGTLAVRESLTGWRIHRSAACGGEPEIDLPPHPVPDASPETGCTLMVDVLPAGLLTAGPCRFEVRLERPGADSVSRTKEFWVVSMSGSSAVSAVSTEGNR